MSIVELLKNVITSWQVLAVTIGIVIYLFIVSAAARISGGRSRPKKQSKSNLFKKKEKVPAAAGPAEVTSSDENHVDDLGIEEA
jgi:hypothetical protein